MSGVINLAIPQNAPGGGAGPQQLGAAAAGQADAAGIKLAIPARVLHKVRIGEGHPAEARHGRVAALHHARRQVRGELAQVGKRAAQHGDVYRVLNLAHALLDTVYALQGKDGNKRSTVMTLNGRDLVMGEGWELPDLSGAEVPAGKLEVAPLGCTFIVL